MTGTRRPVTRARLRDLAARSATATTAAARRPVADREPAVPLWRVDAGGGLVAERAAAFWEPLGDDRVGCSLCYRVCELADGETGWCGVRRNDGGVMTLPEHGALTQCQLTTIGVSGNRFFHPGARALAVGQVGCTAKCAFCTTAEQSTYWRRLPWPDGRERGPVKSGGHMGIRAMGHPFAVMALARRWGCSHISLAINEPMLNIEFTFDVCRLARAAGLTTSLYSNGFSTPAAVERLAPFVDAVDVGIKGSLDDGFYRRWMKSPGGPDAVRASLLAWKRAGVHVLVSTVIATEYQLPDDAHEAAERRLHAWLVTELGADTPLFVVRMHPPETAPGGTDGFLVPSGEPERRYVQRWERAAATARLAGLRYVMFGGYYEAPLRCADCDGVLLQFTLGECQYQPCALFRTGCDCRTHEQHVTAGRCDWCGTAVPVVTLPRLALATQRQQMQHDVRLALAGRHPDGHHLTHSTPEGE